MKLPDVDGDFFPLVRTPGLLLGEERELAVEGRIRRFAEREEAVGVDDASSPGSVAGSDGIRRPNSLSCIDESARVP